ncbi:MAG: hypothetical protein HZA00_12855 [Nitrospinae bacterium]|nr:hypothetical protein [Nitrospinota bacterium]
MTANYTEALWPWRRELSNASQEAFSQVFSHVTIVSQLPEAGQFDAVIQPMLTEIHEDYYGGAIMWGELTLAWTLNVVDKNGTKILSKKGVLPPHRKVEVSINERDKGEVASESLALVVKEWAQKLVSSKELRDYATQLNK